MVSQQADRSCNDEEAELVATAIDANVGDIPLCPATHCMHWCPSTLCLWTYVRLLHQNPCTNLVHHMKFHFLAFSVRA